MARLSLRLLGPFEVSVRGDPISEFAPNKVWALLAYLAVEAHRPHRREILSSLLWPNSPESAARASLRNALANLRRAIGDHGAQPPYLDITRTTVQFDRSSDCRLDVAAFSAIAVADPPAHTVVRQLEEAVALYRGGFLEGFFLKDSAPFDDWCLLTRERLQRQALAAFNRLAEEYGRRGEYGRACDYARRQVELEPWQEEAHCQLMHLLALSGQRSAALAQYEVCRRSLVEELGVEPAAETTVLYAHIRDGQEMTTRPGPPPHNLPAWVTPFVGREAELAEIRDRLLDSGVRLVTLVGPGGSGKTRLAVEAARALLRAGARGVFADGVYFVPLGPLQTIDAIVLAIARSIGLPFHTKGAPRQQLLDYVREKYLLLILDNFEHLLDGAGLVSDILRRAPRSKVVVTSRARLRMAGEHLFPVAGLSYPDWAGTEPGAPQRPRSDPRRLAPDAARTDAVELFVATARRSRPDFELDADNVAGVVRICQLVDGSPLGILLAAMWVRLLTPDEIAAQLCVSLDFLAAELQDLPERQRSMRAVFGQSWDLLTEHERAVLKGLSVFRGGFTREAAQQVTGASLGTLMALVDKSLVERAPAGRYEVHELLRQYASDQLGTGTAASEVARDGHSAYYTAALQRWGGDLKGPRQRAAMETIEADGENVRAAWGWAAWRRDVARLGQAVDGLCLFYERRGRYRDGESACSAAAKGLTAVLTSGGPGPRATEASAADGLRLLARLLVWRGLFTLGLAHPEEARELARQSLDILDRPELTGQDTGPERAFVLCQMGEMAAAHDYEEALRLLGRGLALYEDLGDQWRTANALTRLGWMAIGLGDCSEANRFYGRSLEIQRALGDGAGIAASLTGLRLVAEHRGELGENERLAREALAIQREMGNWLGVAEGLFHLACALVMQGRSGEARPALEESAAISKDIGTRSFFGMANQVLAWAETNLGLYGSARDHFEMSFALSEAMGDREGTSWGILGQGSLELARENYADAYRLLKDSAALFRDLGQRHREGLALAHLAHASLALDELAQAKEQLRGAARAGAEAAIWELIVQALPGIALLLDCEEEPARAVELYALASRYAYIGESRFWEDVAGKPIAAVAARLPSEVVAAARERGRARDLDATVAELLEELAH